jgi:hypothetical protein
MAFGVCDVLLLASWVGVRYFGWVSRYHNDTKAIESKINATGLSEKDVKDLKCCIRDCLVFTGFFMREVQ